MQQALAIIPARGGSKGIFKKNLQKVGGIPLIERTIQAAQKCCQISRVVVSTDDIEIEELASSCKAITIRRPPELSNDTAKSEDALLHTIKELSQQGPIEEKIAFLQCTSPFTTSEDISMVIDALDVDDYNSSFAATSWHGFLWSPEGRGINHNRWKLDKATRFTNHTSETGSIYAMRTDQFILKKPILPTQQASCRKSGL